MADKAPIQMTRTELLAYIQDELYPEIEQLRSQLEWNNIAAKRIWVPSIDVPCKPIEAGHVLPSLEVRYESVVKLPDESVDRPAE